MRNRLLFIGLTLCLLCPNARIATPDESAALSAVKRENVRSEAYVPPDYSDHDFADESIFVTRFGDLTKLAARERIIVKQEGIYDWSQVSYGGLSRKDETFGYDVRHADLSFEDLDKIEDINDLSFNTKTLWPDTLPEQFNPREIMEIGKNPGLGIRDLHNAGFDGTGVGVAIIDQTLLIEHEQYADNLMLYERIHCPEDDFDCASMHGASMASLAVGKDIGVAPGSKLYYIATRVVHRDSTTHVLQFDVIADCILRILEINRHLPEGEKIRVISIAMEYDGSEKGFQEFIDAMKRADEEGIFVATASTSVFYDFSLFAMSRDYLSDPDDFGSYYPFKRIAEYFYIHPEMYLKKINVPGGARTYAACYGESDYETMSEGGVSASVSWFAGFYALCCQVTPEITPQAFIEVVKATCVTTEITHNGEIYSFGKIVNPAAVVAELQN